jgi:hypothetical protein
LRAGTDRKWDELSKLLQNMATATVSTSQTSAPFTYSITLKDAGTTNIGSFWFAWLPGEDFLPTTPTNVFKPSGWSALVTGGGAGDGHAIEFVDNGAPLTPGSSLSGFGFTSSDTPAELAGKSPFFTNTLVGTSFVYLGAPLNDPGFQFAAAFVPEPSCLVLAGIGALIGWISGRKAYRRI